MKVAGIDVHKKVLMVVVVDASMPEEKPARRRSGSPRKEETCPDAGASPPQGLAASWSMGVMVTSVV
jgi:hypothetical protein